MVGCCGVRLCSRRFGRDDYRRIAEANAEFLLRELCTADGRLLSSMAPASLTGDVPQAELNA